jgi:hypothetical protein
MPAVAVLMAIHWRRLLPSAFMTTVIAAGGIVGLVAWLSWLLAREISGDIFVGWPWGHWAILGGSAAMVAAPLCNRRWLPACAVPAALCGFLTLSSFLQVFDPPLGAFPPAAVAAAKEHVVWAPQNFRAASELQTFLLPGAVIRGYPSTAAGPDAEQVKSDDLVILIRGLAEPPPPGAIGSRVELKSRQPMADLLEMLRGNVAGNLFVREWLK